MAVDALTVTRPVASRLQGIALVVYFALLPYVVVTKWRLAQHESHGTLIRTLLVVLALLWIAFLSHLALNVWRLRRGGRVTTGGSAWLAGLVVMLLALVFPTSVSATRSPVFHGVAADLTSAPALPQRRPAPEPLDGLSAVPLALMAKRRSDLLRQEHPGESEFDVDESIELLRARNPGLVYGLIQLIGDSLDGVIAVPDSVPDSVHDATIEGPCDPVVACSLGTERGRALVGYAHEGGRLPVGGSWSNDDVRRNVVALHEGRVLFAEREAELLRLLATRSLRHGVVVYLGSAHDLDDDVAACSITLAPQSGPPPTSVRNDALTPHETSRDGDLLVELLRADPQVVGLCEPFTPALRRRCIEMTAYLALHHHEPVTGERLRTRVLTHADVDASSRTLANTASAVRRSLGVDERGPRLHPVTSSGLYTTHGVTSDVALFSTLITRARSLSVDDAAPLIHRALLLIQGEPLASALRGFEWFLAEGHGARLARDGEWAALALHHVSLQRRNYELAFWSLQQGRLIDPYSDALVDAFARVPRLREFGGDGTSRTQDATVRPANTVEMSWAFARFSQQVSQ